MHMSVILRVTGVLLTLFSVAILAPAVVAFIYSENTVGLFVTAFCITFAAGAILWLSGRGDAELRSLAMRPAR